MDLEKFKQLRDIRNGQMVKYRELCVTCLQPAFGCYCCHIQKFDPKIKFVILIHPIEMKRRIATGRMASLCLQNAELILGQDYSANQQVNQLIADYNYSSMVLYPGPKSLNLTTASGEQKFALLNGEKKLLIFVIDGTWATARKTMFQSANLKVLPRIGFVPPAKSNFRVRKQPGVNCYSTIEAVHHCIELLGPTVGFDNQSRVQDNLLHVFNVMVERQLHFLREAYDSPRPTSYRRPRKRLE